MRIARCVCADAAGKADVSGPTLLRPLRPRLEQIPFSCDACSKLPQQAPPASWGACPRPGRSASSLCQARGDTNGAGRRLAPAAHIGVSWQVQLPAAQQRSCSATNVILSREKHSHESTHTYPFDRVVPNRHGSSATGRRDFGSAVGGRDSGAENMRSVSQRRG